MMIDDNKIALLAESAETGKIGIMHLKRYWAKLNAKRQGNIPQNAFPEEWNMDTTLLAVLGLGLANHKISV